MPLMRYVVLFISLGFMAGQLAMAGATTNGELPKRPYRVTDGGALENIDSATSLFSPDGESVALVRMRPKDSQAVSSIVIEETRADVWVQDRRGRPLRNLTNGHTDASGWWAPEWSPDGERLAMLSSRGGQVTLWVWERAANQMRQVSPLGVDFSESGGFEWLDANSIVALALPEGEVSTPVGTDTGKYTELTTAAWEKARRGEVTASPISSLRFPIPERRLVVIDLRLGSSTEIATTQLANFRGAEASSWWVSPDARAVASRQSMPTKNTLYGDVILGWPASIQLHWLDGRPVRVERELPNNVITETIRWSPDGKEVVFFAYGDRPIHPIVVYREGMMDVVQTPAERTAPLLKHPARLYRVNVDSGEVTEWATSDIGIDPTNEEITAFVNPTRRIAPEGTPLDLPPFAWTERGELLFKEMRGTKADTWSMLGRNGRTRAGTEQMQAGFEKDAAMRAARDRFEKRTKPPMEGAKLVAFSAETVSGLYYARNLNGQFLWRVSSDSAIEELAAVNTFLKHVDRGTPRLIDYTTAEGKRARAYALLPPGYVTGRRYPLVVDSDIGYEDEIIEWFYQQAISGDEWGPTQGEDFAAGGYVYMFASMPTRNEMDPAGRANLLLFTHGILPAVGEAIELGIADADRVFLYGASSMGYGVFGLVTQTARFKAAVAQCGWADQITYSLLGPEVTRHAPWRLADARVLSAYSYFYLPFWRNEAHLRRNSPLSYVDRVQTPLMIIHGDLDFVPMASAEMFFAALIQQRKPAEFVRYWGEGHGIQNPKNYADYHQRMFAWFDSWGDIARDTEGNILFDKDRGVQSRNGAPPLKPEAYAQFDAFGPGGEEGIKQWLAKRAQFPSAGVIR